MSKKPGREDASGLTGLRNAVLQTRKQLAVLKARRAKLETQRARLKRLLADENAKGEGAEKPR